MKALSIKQPWAWLILAGHKPVENRTWSSSHRGPLLIHAAKKNDPLPEDVDGFLKADGIYIPSHLPVGCIVGIVNMVDCVNDHPSKWFYGPKCFVFENPRLITPVPCVGRLGFFTPGADVLAQVSASL